MGMPVDSVDAAHAWRDRNVRPMMAAVWASPALPTAPNAEDAHAKVDELNRRACRALSHGMFAEVAADLREALRAVPAEARGAVQLDLAVWNALLWEWAGSDPEDGDAGSPAQPMTEAEADRWGRFWYGLAAQERFVNSPFTTGADRVPE